MSTNQTTSVIDQPLSFGGRLKARLRKMAVPVSIISSGIVIYLIMGSMAPKPEKKPVINKAPLVEILKVSAGTVVFEIESQGSISPRTKTTLVSEVSGQIKNVSQKFVVGGFFKKGEQLLEIDPISYEVALLQAQARLDGANAKLVEEGAKGKQAAREWSLTGRSSKNAPILALRKPQLQQAKADVKAAQADVKSAEIKLQRTKIIAPYDAMLKSKLVDIGQYVTTGTQLAETFAVDYAEIRLPIKEQDLAYIDIPAMGEINQKGSQVELSTFQAGKLKKWSTFITRSEGVVDAKSRVNYVVAQIDDPYGLSDKNQTSDRIRIGTFVKAKIIGNPAENIIAIPRKAVRGENQIYLLNSDNKLDLARVDILRADDRNIYISAGIENNSHIVLTKLATAVKGMSLRVKGENNIDSLDGTQESILPIEADGSHNEELMVASKKDNDLLVKEALEGTKSEKGTTNGVELENKKGTLVKEQGAL